MENEVTVICKNCAKVFKLCPVGAASPVAYYCSDSCREQGEKRKVLFWEFLLSIYDTCGQCETYKRMWSDTSLPPVEWVFQSFDDYEATFNTMGALFEDLHKRYGSDLRYHTDPKEPLYLYVNKGDKQVGIIAKMVYQPIKLNFFNFIKDSYDFAKENDGKKNQ